MKKNKINFLVFLLSSILFLIPTNKTVANHENMIPDNFQDTMIDSNINSDNLNNPSGFNNSDDGFTSGPQIKNKPKLVIDSYQMDPKIVKAGESFDLNISFYNTNSINSIRNLKITLSSEDTTQNSGSVFIPDNTSNTFYTSYIAPEGETHKSIRLYVVPDAAQRTYSMIANFEYEDADGNEFTSSESFGIPVYQNTELSIGELNMPNEIYQYDMNYFSVPFYNTGKTTLYNLKISTESDINLDKNDLYIGNFTAGSQDQFEISFSPDESGPFSGKILFKYEDISGKEFVQEINFGGEVIEMELDPFLDMDEIDVIDTSPSWAPIIGVGIILLIIVIVYFLRRRKRKKEEEALEINE